MRTCASVTSAGAPTGSTGNHQFVSNALQVPVIYLTSLFHVNICYTRCRHSYTTRVISVCTFIKNYNRVYNMEMQSLNKTNYFIYVMILVFIKVQFVSLLRFFMFNMSYCSTKCFLAGLKTHILALISRQCYEYNPIQLDELLRLLDSILIILPPNLY